MKYTPAVRRGFHTQVENYINIYDNAEADPYIQVFDNEDDEEELEQVKYFCAICKKQIRYYHDLQEYFCNNCGQHYNTRIQDRPVSDNRGFRVTPHVDIWRYAKIDAEDINVPFAKGIDLGGVREVEEVELIKSSPDQRIQHLRVRGSMAEALRLDI